MIDEKEDPTEPNPAPELPDAEPNAGTLPELPAETETPEVTAPEGVYQLNHAACGGVAFYLVAFPAPMQHILSMDKYDDQGRVYLADKDGTVTCQHCGAGLKHLFARHVTPVKI